MALLLQAHAAPMLQSHPFQIRRTGRNSAPVSVPAQGELPSKSFAARYSDARDFGFAIQPEETRLDVMADALNRSYVRQQKSALLPVPLSALLAGTPAPASAAGVAGRPHFVLLFDFDHTLSTEDSGEKLAHAHNIAAPKDIFARMRREDPSTRPGGELAAALATAPEFAAISQDDLARAGAGVGLKANVGHVFHSLCAPHADYQLSLFVLSAGPTETIRTALSGVVAPAQIQGTRLLFGPGNDKRILHVSAGQGKADYIDALLCELGVPARHLLFAGDGSSDEVAFRYSRERGGFNILVKDNPALLPLSHAQVFGNDLLGVVQVVQDHIAGVLGG